MVLGHFPGFFGAFSQDFGAFPGAARGGGGSMSRNFFGDFGIPELCPAPQRDLLTQISAFSGNFGKNSGGSGGGGGE